MGMTADDAPKLPTGVPSLRGASGDDKRTPLVAPKLPRGDEAPKKAKDSEKSKPATKFDRKPASDDTEDKGIAGAVRRNIRQIEHKSELEARENKGKKADPKSDKPGEQGARDATIAQLKEENKEARTERKAAQGLVADLTMDVKDGEKKADVMAKVSGFMMPVLGIVEKATGTNPVEAAMEVALGVDDDREELEETKETVVEQTEAVRETSEQLETERVLNFLSETAEVTGMSDEVSEFLEDGEIKVGDMEVQLEVAEDTGTGSDGVFDSGTEAITVDEDVLADSAKDFKALVKAGIVDADGNIVDEEAFQESEHRNIPIKTTTLLGVHELNHAHQHSEEDFELAFHRKRMVIVRAMQDLPANATPAQIQQARDKAEAKGERLRVDLLEVDSYRKQEKADLKAGADKKAFITIDEQGHALPRDKQLDNVIAYTTGKPLPHGPTQGYVNESALDEVEDAHDHGHEGDDHGHEEHGHDHTSGEHVVDGFRGPGFRGPGLLAMGTLSDGFRGPGFRGPGETADGNIAMGLSSDGFRGPGLLAMGTLSDGFRGPGFRGPGETADGNVADGFRGPGFRGPGSITD